MEREREAERSRLRGEHQKQIKTELEELGEALIARVADPVHRCRQDPDPMKIFRIRIPPKGTRSGSGSATLLIASAKFGDL